VPNVRQVPDLDHQALPTIFPSSFSGLSGLARPLAGTGTERAPACEPHLRGAADEVAGADLGGQHLYLPPGCCRWRRRRPVRSSLAGGAG
jgi:hypothetical protein